MTRAAEQAPTIRGDMTVAPETARLPLRLGLLASGLLVFQTGFSIWLQTESFWHPATMLLNVSTWVFGIACLLLGTIRNVPRRTEWLVLAAVLGALWGGAYLQRLDESPSSISRTDNEMIGEYSAQTLRYGYNPYAWNFSDASRVYQDAGLRVTTFLDGTVQNRITYPALPTLLLFVFDRAGVGQARTVSLVFHSVLLLLLFLGAPAGVRPLIALPLVVNRDFIVFTLSGLQDVVWSTFLVAMVLAWRRPVLRAILFGLACAYRQQPWLVAPFLAIQLWHAAQYPSRRKAASSGRPPHPRLARVLEFSGISLGVFLLLNLPFMAWDLSVWSRGVFEPLYAAFNVYSHGMGALEQYAILSYPRSLAAAFQLSLYTIFLIVHWRHPRAVGQSFWMFPAILFWMHYRGLANYWLYWIPPLLISLVRPASNTAPKPNRHRWRWTALRAAGVTSVILIAAALQARSTGAIQAWLSAPIESYNGRTVSRLGLIVTNRSERTLRPRFSVQRDNLQPLPWEVEAGPEALPPGKAAVYVISTREAGRDFLASRGAQVVITDLSNDYGLRTVIDVPPDRTLASPDLIANPSFGVWLAHQGLPVRWNWSTTDPHAGSPRYSTIEGRPAILLPSGVGTSQLSQTVTFPDSFSIWVRPVPPAGEAPQGSYGLEIHDGAHRLWILFGDREGIDLIEPGFAVVHVRAPFNQWSRQTIRPPDLYRQLGWALPTYSIRTRQGLQFGARQARISLLVADIQQPQPFGALEQDPAFAEPRSLVDHALAHPDEYYLNLGNEYCRQRNFELAQEAFRIALQYNPDSLEVSRAMDSCP